MTRQFCPLIIALVGFSWGAAKAVTYDEWVRDRILTARTKESTVLALQNSAIVSANSERAIRQREAPSADLRSTSLVDQSSATDFVNVAVALAPHSVGGSADGNNGSGVVTASAYSILALLNKTSLTDPTFYKNHVTARQVTFTLGSTASDVTKDNTNKPGTTIGFKVTLWNEREIYTKRNQGIIAGLQARLSGFGPVNALLTTQIELMLFCESTAAAPIAASATYQAACSALDIGRFAPLEAGAFGTFTGTQINAAFLAGRIERRADAMIDAKMETLAGLTAAVNDAYDQIKSGRQLALTATYIERPDLGTDDFRSSLVFDYGLSSRINWTINGGFDHRNRKGLPDVRGGRFATEFLGRLTGYGDSLWGRQPVTLAFAGEGKWLSSMKPKYVAQVKLTIPISGGLNLPIVYRWAKRGDLFDQDGKELRMGLTVDLGSLAATLTK